MATNATADGSARASSGNEAWRKLREWAPVLGVLLAILALFVALAILFGATLGRMEERLRTDAAADKAEVLAQIESVRADVESVRADVESVRADVESVRADVRTLGTDLRADMRALRQELAPVGDILELLKARQ